MKAIQLKSPGADFELIQKEIPEPKENEVLIKVEACGICHGDSLVKEGHTPGIKYPITPGHEVVGIVHKVGTSGCDMENRTEGWRGLAWRTLFSMQRLP